MKESAGPRGSSLRGPAKALKGALFVSVFRYKQGIPVTYEDQGYIYFFSRRYDKLGNRDQKRIQRLCAAAGKEYSRAVFDFITTDMGAARVCVKHFISEKTLERAVRRYYILFASGM